MYHDESAKPTLISLCEKRYSYMAFLDFFLEKLLIGFFGVTVAGTWLFLKNDTVTWPTANT